MATQDELEAAIARKRGLAPGGPAPQGAPEPRPSALQALGTAASRQIGPALKETGAAAARMFVPGYNLYEESTRGPQSIPVVQDPHQATRPGIPVPKSVRYSLAALNDLMALLPSISAVRHFRRVPLKGPAPPGMQGQRIPIRAGVEKAREIESDAHIQLLKDLRLDQTAKEYYQAAEVAAKENAEVYYAPRVSQALDAFLTKHAPTIRQKAGLIETFPKSYVEKTVIKEPGAKPKLSSTESVQMRSTQTIQQSEQFASGVEKSYHDLAGLSDKLKASGSAIDPADWKSVKNQVQSLYNAAKGDPRRGDLVPILRAFREDLSAMKSPSSELMQQGDDVAHRQAALKHLSEVALENFKNSTTPEGKAIYRFNGHLMGKELVHPDNKYLMSTFSPLEKKVMERTWGAISKIQELDAGSKNTVQSALATVRVGDKIGLRLGEFAGQGVMPSRPFAIDMINTAMLLPGGPQLLRSVTTKGMISQTGQLMIANFLLSTARANMLRDQKQGPTP